MENSLKKALATAVAAVAIGATGVGIYNAYKDSYVSVEEKYNKLCPLKSLYSCSFYGLRLGDSEVSVIDLQKSLNLAGFNVASEGVGSLGQETTTFGRKTYLALREFQKDRGLDPTGFVDYETWFEIYKTIKEKNQLSSITIENSFKSYCSLEKINSKYNHYKIYNPYFCSDYNVRVGDIRSVVIRLQQFLNLAGFNVASEGKGSPGQETTTFGEGTSRALREFQEHYSLEITGSTNHATYAKINEIIAKKGAEYIFPLIQSRYPELTHQGWVQFPHKKPGLLGFLNQLEKQVPFKTENKINSVVDFKYEENEWTLLHSAVFNKRINDTLVLIEIGADLNVKDKDGKTPLHYAAHRHFEHSIVTALLKAGANPSIKDNKGYIPSDYPKDRDGVIHNMLKEAERNRKNKDKISFNVGCVCNKGIKENSR